ncbi:hypothetical protein DY000_02005254 [Brassica cretica]|uniref:Uncharacterized protein n=1 Tax=Brassica cretica TaxID=69181 RepID=A0ABQ7BS66_BRACR|nr:hypothetical protein DY000_02005254 [Brassica cretica]
MLVIGGLPGFRLPVSFGASFAFSTVVWAGGPNLRVAGTISAEEELVSVHVIAVLRVLAMVSSLENFLSGTVTAYFLYITTCIVLSSVAVELFFVPLIRFCLPGC